MVRDVGPLASSVMVAAWCVCACRMPHARGEAVDGGDGGREAGSVDAAPDAAASTLAVEGGPPDDELPATAGDELAERGRHLLEAIASDQADLANDIVFPRDGWLSTHDAADPGKDWQKRVATPFRKAVHGLSRHHQGLDRAQFVSFELGRSLSQGSVRRHGLKKALWVVHGSRLSFVVDGRTRTLPIRELTAWRGAWYVTRLR